MTDRRQEQYFGNSKSRKRGNTTTKTNEGKGNRHSNKQSFPVLLIPVILLLLLLGAGGAWYYIKEFLPSRTLADLNAYFDVAGDNVQVYLNDEKQRTETDYLVIGRQSEDHVFLPYEWVIEKLNRRFYWDKSLNSFLYCLPDKTLIMSDRDVISDGSPGFIQDGKDLFINADWVKEHTDLRMDVFIKDEEHKRIFLYMNKNKETRGTLTKEEGVRLDPDIKSDVLTFIEKGDSASILDTMDEWSLVRSSDGFIGYLRTDKLKDIEEVQLESEYKAPVYKYLRRVDGNKLQLGFHLVTLSEANDSIDSLANNAEGMDVIAPTWFIIKNDNGDFKSYASADYVNKAHSRGLSVWAVVNNFDEGNIDESVFLSNATLRADLIKKLIDATVALGIDGINIDFETISSSLGRDYVQFMRELSIACRNAGKVLSVDCYVPYEYNNHYDLEELGLFCDYVIIMCYDEHYSGSEEAGSVASISYVDRGIREALNIMPKEAILIALPFFTRVWNTKDGKVSSKALGISSAAEWVSEHNVNLTWDAETGQNYGEKKEEDGLKQIWMEDASSIDLKMSHIRDSDLAGVAAWRLGFEPSGFWSHLNW